MRVLGSTDNNIDATTVTNLSFNSLLSDTSGNTNFLGSGITNLTIAGSTFDHSGNAAGEHGVFITGLFGTSSVTNTDFTPFGGSAVQGFQHHRDGCAGERGRRHPDDVGRHVREPCGRVFRRQHPDQRRSVSQFSFHPQQFQRGQFDRRRHHRHSDQRELGWRRRCRHLQHHDNERHRRRHQLQPRRQHGRRGLEDLVRRSRQHPHQSRKHFDQRDGDRHRRRDPGFHQQQYDHRFGGRQWNYHRHRGSARRCKSPGCHYLGDQQHHHGCRQR